MTTLLDFNTRIARTRDDIKGKVDECMLRVKELTGEDDTIRPEHAAHLETVQIILEKCSRNLDVILARLDWLEENG